ncbi:unnamed protein product [Phytomonas sp. EM1]|nr:unnamed protein product [Phytomonas sp. EM1]|eukprot:CCW63284.1 unnamed protein product [Phytomonas sp. isolate EM1]
MPIQSSVDSDQRRSFLESVAVLLDDADISSPLFHAIIGLFAIDENTPDEVGGDSSSKDDHLVEAMMRKSSLAPELAMEEDLDLFVKGDFMSGFLKKNVEVEGSHTEDREWDKRHPGFVLTNLSVHEEQCYRRHVRELSVLLAILERPPGAFMLGGPPPLYRKIMQRLKGDNLIDILVARIETVQKGLQIVSRLAVAELLQQLLALYVDILFYFSFHLNEAESESLITGELLDRMVKIVMRLSSTGRSTPPLQRSSLVLICIIVKHISRIRLSMLQHLLEGSLSEPAGRANMMNFILLAALPCYSLRNAEPAVEEWLQQALEVLRQCTMYDLDVDDIFLREGPYARQHTFLIKYILGAALHNFLTHVSAFWWTCCSTSALVSTARSCFIYSFTWSKIPHGVFAFLEFVRSHLRSCACLPSGGPDAVEQKAKALSLLCEEGTCGEIDRSRSPYISQLSSFSPAKEEIGVMGLECGDQAAAATQLNFDNAEARCVFFLTLYSYISATFLFHCDRLSDADGIFFLNITPHPPHVSASNQVTLKLPFPAVPLWRGDELNLLSQCVEFLLLEITSELLPVSPLRHMHGNFYDAAVSLLYSILSLFPQEKSLADSIANRNLSDLFVQLLFHHLKPNDLFIERRDVAVLRMIFSLLKVYFNAVMSLSSVTAKLLTENIAAAFSKGFTAAVNSALLHLTAYVNLCQRAEERMISPNRLLLFLTDLDRGVLSGSPEAMQFFACLMVRLEETAETIGFRIPIMLEETTQEKAKILVERLFEGAAGLIRVYQNGCLSLCGHSTFRLIELLLTIVLEIMRVCEQFSPVATILLPSMEGCNDGNEVPVSYVLLSCIAAPTFPPCLSAAQLLGAALQRGHALFPVLSSNLLSHSWRALSALLHQTLRTQAGTPGNVIRLEVLTVLGARDLATLEYLTGPDSIPGNRQAVELEDLAISKVLCDVVLQEGASLAEKSSALELLVILGLTESLPLDCVTSFLSEDIPHIKDTGSVIEQVAITATATRFINTVISIQMCKCSKSHQAGRGIGSSRLILAPPADSPGNSSSPNINGKYVNTIPLRSGQAVHADTIDFVLRRGSALLERVARCYDELCRQVHHATGVPLKEWQAALSTSMSSAILPSTTLSLTTANGLRAMDLQLAISQLRLHRKQLWNHHPTYSWVEASRSGAASSTMGCSSSRQKLFHTEVLPNSIEVEEAAYRVVCPLVLGEAYCFIGSGDDTTFNLMASILEAVRRMAVALESTLWLSVNETESSRILLERYFQMLRGAIEWVTQCKPTAPLLARPLWECTSQCLQLTNATSRVLESFSLSSGQRLEVDAPTRRVVYHLLEFMRENTTRLALLNPCLNVIATLGREDNIGVDFEEIIFSILADVLFAEERQKEVKIGPEHLVFLDGFIKIFDCLPPNSCPLLVLAPLIRCLFRRATAISFSIAANSPGDIHTSYFVLALRCMQGALLKARAMGALSLLPLEEIMAMMDTLNVFPTTFITDSALSYCRQSWHVVWCSLLELLTSTISTLSGIQESGDDTPPIHSVAQRPLLEAIEARLLYFPRFLVALGGFTEVVGPDHAPAPSFVWDVEELELCVRLVAQLSVLIRPMSSLIPVIQRCFMRIHRYRLHGFDTTSSSDPVIVQSEKNMIRNLLVRAVQSQLTFFIIQPFHGVPSIINEKGEVCAVVAALPSQSGRNSSTFTVASGNVMDGSAHTEKPSLTLDVLWRFISHEFHIIRRAKSALKGRALDTTPSVESSVTRSPSRGHDVESCGEEDFAASDIFAGMQTEQRSVHLDNIQLALALYTLAVEELGEGEARVGLTGAAATPHKRELRVCTEKLLHVLGNIVHEMKRMGSPHLLNMLDCICDRLNTTIARL